MKSPGLAFLLSFLLPGAGLWYLRRWKYGFVNLGVVLLLGVILALVLSEDAFFKCIQYVAVGCAGGSAGLAQNLAERVNQKRRQDNAARETRDGP